MPCQLADHQWLCRNRGFLHSYPSNVSDMCTCMHNLLRIWAPMTKALACTYQEAMRLIS